MEIKTMEAALFCSHCREEVNHEITYINDDIKSIRCEQCNKTKQLRVDVNKKFYKEVYDRISSKPTRITQEYKDDLSHLLVSLPVRTVSKPYRLLKDVNASRKILKRYKQKKSRVK